MANFVVNSSLRLARNSILAENMQFRSSQPRKAAKRYASAKRSGTHNETRKQEKTLTIYVMKKLIISLFVLLATTTTLIAQDQTTPMSIVSPDNNLVYRLFSTKNKWTYIKLNTRNGQMWQVQYSLEDNNREDALNLITLVSKEEEKNGRFFLYPTQNIYNFILLDQIDGRVWQVQWSIEEKNRMVARIY